jgi:transcriptional regulator with XRE-family HTH domain
MTIRPQSKLWEVLKLRGLTQVRFAQLVGEPASTVSRVISGQWNLSEAKQIRWAAALGMSVEELFARDKECRHEDLSFDTASVGTESCLRDDGDSPRPGRLTVAEPGPGATDRAAPPLARFQAMMRGREWGTEARAPARAQGAGDGDWMRSPVRMINATI